MLPAWVVEKMGLDLSAHGLSAVYKKETPTNIKHTVHTHKYFHQVAHGKI